MEKDKLLALALLHDIGAYKTEEIDNLLGFETKNVDNHALYGYVFLKNVTYLGDYAEAIRYHHTDYNILEGINSPYKLYAELIYLADRTDIMLSIKGKTGLCALRKFSGTRFSPRLVDALCLAEEKYGISAAINDKSFLSVVEEQIINTPLNDDDALSFLKLLVYSIDFRSEFTVTHTANTVLVANYLAARFNLSDKERDDISAGAFLHDIGKLAIPYSILEGTGRLTNEEMEIMKTHVAVSEKILRGIVSNEVCNIAVRNHEKLNGKGYCHGLTGAELNLSERIVAVADIISALINRRSYKEPFTKEKSVSILENMKNNGEICPRVCDMAVVNFDEILALAKTENDPVIKLYESLKAQYVELSK